MTASALDAFLEALVVERGAAANTVAAYRRDLENAEEALGCGLEASGEADLRGYLAGLLQDGLSPRTVSRRRSALRQFFLFCTAEGYRPDNPADKLDAPKIGRPLPRHLGVEELRALIEAIESYDGPARLRLGCIVELLYGTGLRVSELVGLAMSDVPPGRAWLTVRGKGGRERVVPLGGPARAAIDATDRGKERALDLYAVGAGVALLVLDDEARREVEKTNKAPDEAAMHRARRAAARGVLSLLPAYDRLAKELHD